MGRRRSELQQPVAPLFSTPRPERQATAVPVLRRMRQLVAGGTTLLDALFAAGDAFGFLPREFARHELMHVLLPGTEFDGLARWGDCALWLYFIDKALSACGCLHRGGHHVTRARGAA